MAESLAGESKLEGQPWNLIHFPFPSFSTTLLPKTSHEQLSSPPLVPLKSKKNPLFFTRKNRRTSTPTLDLEPPLPSPTSSLPLSIYIFHSCHLKPLNNINPHHKQYQTFIIEEVHSTEVCNSKKKNCLQLLPSHLFN